MTTIYRSEAGASEIRAGYRAMLEQWPVPAEHVRVPTCQGETFVVVSGPADAPPVVLLHGSGANTTVWMADVAAWSEHFRCYAVDLVGEPGHSAPSRPRLDTDASTRWLDDVLDGLGIPGAAFVGMSFGGWTALDYATRRPGRVTRLALLCPAGVGRQKYARLILALFWRLFGRWGVRRSVRTVAGVDPGPDLDRIALVFSQFRPRSTPFPVFSDEKLRGIEVPTLVIVGGRDALFDSASTARRSRASIPQAAVTVLPEAGHAIFGQTAPILEFLRASR